MSFKFIDGVSLADIAFEAKGKTLEGMFESAGNALMNTQVKDLKTIEQKKEVKFELANIDIERLLQDFLQELIFYKDAKLLLFSKYKIKIKEDKKNNKFVLRASVKGEKINMKKHELLVDVKAVSWHRYEVKKVKTGWSCFVILDV